MTNLILPRRKFLLGLGALVAAPAVIRVARLMPVRPFDDVRNIVFDAYGNRYEEYTSWFRYQESLIPADWKWASRIIVSAT